jgi:hypothetical protein
MLSIESTVYLQSSAYSDVRIVQMQIIPAKIIVEQDKHVRPNRSPIITHTVIPTISVNEEMAKLTKIFPPNLATFIVIP